MPTDDPRAATVTDPDGHDVVLLIRIWEEKIARDHPELLDHIDAVMETVAKPDHVEPDSLHARTRSYRRNVGPSRWLMAVVSYEQEPARIITGSGRWSSTMLTMTLTATSYTCTSASLGPA